MWLDEAPDQSELLRQGDLLANVVLPELTFPLPSSGAGFTLNSKTSNFLVVSQCCEIENGSSVAVAPVTRTKPLAAEERSPFEAEEPTIGDDINYVYAAHRLDPVGGVLGPLENQFHIANFALIASFKKAEPGLRPARVSSMTPHGRRLLRIRLHFYFARHTAEDESWFLEHDLPPGLS